MSQHEAALAALSIIAGLVIALRPPQEEPVPAPVHIPVRSLTLASVPEPNCPEEQEDIFIPLDTPIEVELQEYAAECCEAYDPPVPVEVVVAIVEHESGGNPDAIGYNANGSADYGLMQINSCTLPMLHRELGIQNMDELLDPETNLRAGIHILAQHATAYPDNPEAVLMAYQYGVSGARDNLASGITGTKFSRTVMARVEGLRCERRKTTKFVIEGVR